MSQVQSFIMRPARHLAWSALCLSLVLSGAGLSTGQAAPEKPKLSEVIEAPPYDATKVNMDIGQSITVDVPKGVKTIYIADPTMLEANLRSPTQLNLSGRLIGTTEVFLQDEDGNSLASYRIFIKRNLALLQEILKATAPDLDLKLQTTGRGVILSGDVNSEAEAARIEAAIRGALSPDELVGFLNQLAIRESDQVMIKLTIAEVQHNILKQLGVRTNAGWVLGGTSLKGKGSTGISDGVGTIAANVNGKELFSVQALEREGVLRTLAEPTLTAVSGGEAKFTAGGQIPILGAFSYVGGVSTRTVTYKDVGVDLTFKPQVISSGKIRLTVLSEVNEIDPSNAYTFDGNSYPGFRKRRMDTTVELPSGAALMTAGLLQQQSSVEFQGIPGLVNIPVLGALFRSREFQRRETELMIVVTPFIAKTSRPDKVPLPTDAFRLTDDKSQILQNQMVQRYGINRAEAANKPISSTRGVGFITK